MQVKSLLAKTPTRSQLELVRLALTTVTDLHSSLIIENTMVPAFQAADFSGGIAAAVEDIIMVLEGNSAELAARARHHQSASSSDGFGMLFIDLLILLATVLFFGVLGFMLFARIFGRRLGPGRYKWLGIEIDYTSGSGGSSSRGSRAAKSSSSRGGFSDGGGSSGGGGASGRW